MKYSSVSFLWITFVALLVATCCESKQNRDAPHIHRGVLSSYEPGPFDSVDLDEKDEKELKDGKPIMKMTPAADGELAGSSICVQDIEAPKEAVWKQILDLEAYKGKVPKVNECKNYVQKINEDGTSTIKTKMRVGVIPGYSFTSFYDHKYSPDKDSMTWRLDYDKTSDFDDVSGHWHLEAHPSKPNCTRVFYACDVKLKGAVPGPVVNYISKSALKTATGWVKKESESNPAEKLDLAFVDKSKFTADVE